MDLGSLLLIVAVLVLVGLFISRPFFTLQPSTDEAVGTTDEQESQHSALMAEHERTLTALQELDFDFALGKIPPEDYPEQRALLLQTGAQVLRQLDTFQAQTPQETAEDRLEAVITARRADAGQDGNINPSIPVISTDDADLERLILSRRQARQEKTAGFCPRCGKPVQKSDLFCPKCGAKLA
ncbi:MAG: zinc ribbon domain-containing protein [Anaerolineaceae bacterium]|nr:zinc ribbon domain-containing protein [Anaerolineaceae bacterium]